MRGYVDYISGFRMNRRIIATVGILLGPVLVSFIRQTNAAGASDDLLALINNGILMCSGPQTATGRVELNLGENGSIVSQIGQIKETFDSPQSQMGQIIDAVTAVYVDKRLRHHNYNCIFDYIDFYNTAEPSGANKYPDIDMRRKVVLSEKISDAESDRIDSALQAISGAYSDGYSHFTNIKTFPRVACLSYDNCGYFVGYREANLNNSNGWYNYLAFFRINPLANDVNVELISLAQVIPVGVGYIDIESLDIDDDNELRFRYTTYGVNDAWCCPSIITYSTVGISENGAGLSLLVENIVSDVK
jgi:hypothetical protein